MITNGAVEFRNVSAKYLGGENYVIKNLSLKIEKGKKVGVVGRTGSGKSTLVKLLWRYLHSEKGEILIDGQDINSFDLKDLRRSLNIISQDINLFKSTLLRNIDLVGNSIVNEAQKEKTKRILERLGFSNQQYV